LEKRERASGLVKIAIAGSSILLSLLAGATLFWAVGLDPWQVYLKFGQVFLTSTGLAETLVRATPLMLIALGLIPAFRSGFWNIGAEGQLHMGAFGATLVVMTLAEMLGGSLIPLMLVVSFLLGSIWGVIPAILRAKLQVNEVLTTLMMNFIAILWIDYLVYGPWRDPEGYGFPLTAMFPEAARLPGLLGTRVHTGFLIGLVTTVVIYIIMNWTILGYSIKVTGDSPQAARYAGISYTKTIILVMIISGGLAGLAGMGLVSGIVFRLRHGISPGYGYTAIIVAWLGRLNPWATAVSSILFGGLLVGGDVLQMAFDLPVATVFVFQALILIFLLVGEVFYRYRIRVMADG
jgi:simple sugar transport system permease protein